MLQKEFVLSCVSIVVGLLASTPALACISTEPPQPLPVVEALSNGKTIPIELVLKEHPAPINERKPPSPPFFETLQDVTFSGYTIAANSQLINLSDRVSFGVYAAKQPSNKPKSAFFIVSDLVKTSENRFTGQIQSIERPEIAMGVRSKCGG